MAETAPTCVPLMWSPAVDGSTTLQALDEAGDIGYESFNTVKERWVWLRSNPVERVT